jgi:hypothetical protein
MGTAQNYVNADSTCTFSSESTCVDREMLGDLSYVMTLFHNYFSETAPVSSHTNSTPCFYYQYGASESPTPTLYEQLMASRQICISSPSCHKAKVCNAILQVLIDGDTSSLQYYIDLYDNMERDCETPPLTITNLFVVISNSDRMSEHNGHNSGTIKDPVSSTCRDNENIVDGIELSPDDYSPVRVFDLPTIHKILDLVLVGNFNANNRKEFVIDVLCNGIHT